MNPKALIPLVVGVAIAGVAAKLGFDYIQKAKGAETKTISLWAPTADIPRGTAITEAMLHAIEFPVSAAPKGALAKLDRIVGRVPHTGCPAGLPLLDSMLLPPGAQAGINVPAGMRAVAVKIDESSGLDNHLEPGSHVDVVGYFTTRENNKMVTIAKTLLENVEVAAVGERLAPEAPPNPETAGANAKKTSKQTKARTVTLIVRPQQVPTLHLAEQKGKIKLSLRGGDDSTFNTASDGALREVDLLGLDTDKGGEDQESWVDRVAALFSGLSAKQPEPPADAPPAAEPDPDPEPALAWVMVVYNGDQRQLLGWSDLKSHQPLELDADGPNLFNDRKDRPRRPNSKANKSDRIQNPPTPPDQIDFQPPGDADSIFQDGGESTDHDDEPESEESPE